jgi:hypothetical protein
MDVGSEAVKSAASRVDVPLGVATPAHASLAASAPLLPLGILLRCDGWLDIALPLSLILPVGALCVPPISIGGGSTRETWRRPRSSGAAVYSATNGAVAAEEAAVTASPSRNAVPVAARVWALLR